MSTGRAKIVVDNIICIDHSIHLSYPNGMEKVMHPEMESNGPAEYDISAVEQWLHEKQKNGGCIDGNEIYTYLKKTDMLKTCLGLRDLEEIQKKGIVFFQKHFQNKAIFGWKGVVLFCNDSLRSPYLCDDGDKVVLHWCWLGRSWLVRSPALRLASRA